MTICSQCQFDNPDSNRFCERCGAPLGSDSENPTAPDINHALNFSEDGENPASVQHPWLAILMHGSAAEAKSYDSSREFLDANQRYRCVEILSQPGLADSSPPSDAVTEMLVEDCQPQQVSGFMTLKQQLSDSAILSPDQSHSQIPLAVQPYLALWQHSFQNLPEIHDAWQQDGQTAILLQDYSHLTPLLDFWSNEDIVVPQIVYLLRELTRLWMALEPWQACHSLLEVDNLRVDEDEILCLKRLYSDPVDSPATLQDLGQLFFRLFEQSNRTLFGPLISLCADLNAGRITAVEDLKSQLDAIAADLDAAPPAVVDESVDEPMGGSVGEFVDDSWGEQTIEEMGGADFALEGDRSGPLDLGLGAAAQSSLRSDNDDLPTVALPMRLLSLEDAGRTDIGRQRDHNEDCFSIQTAVEKFDSPRRNALKARGLYILCDGMGGHAGGEVASATAVEALQNYFAEHWQDQLPSEDMVRDAIHCANQAIYDLNQEDDRAGSGRMGTTLVMLLLQGNQAIIAHVGDSRLYSLSRRQGLKQQTVDHEVGQREIKRGIDPKTAYAREDAYQLTQALGPRDSSFIKPSIQRLELNEGLLFLLCSDGLSDNELLEKHCKTHVSPLISSRSSLEKGIDDLMTLANKENGHDNITVILVRIKVRPDMDQLNPGAR